MKTEKCSCCAVTIAVFRAPLSRAQKSAFSLTIAYLVVYVQVVMWKMTRRNVCASTNVHANITMHSYKAMRPWKAIVKYAIAVLVVSLAYPRIVQIAVCPIGPNGPNAYLTLAQA